MPNLNLQLLGSPQIYLDDAPLRDFVTRKTQALLIYLAVAGQAHTRQALAGLFWGNLSDQQASNNLRRVLPNLRTLVGSHLLIDRQQLQFDRTRPYWLDVEIFTNTVQVGLTATGATAQGIEQLKSALALYQGDFLAGFSLSDAPDFEVWALLQREYLRRLAILGFDKLIDLYLHTEQPEAALQATKQLLALEPWYETAYYKQMVILAQLGQRTAALTQYELCRTLLADEFAAEPSSALTTLYEQLKTGNVHRWSSQPEGRLVDAGAPDRALFDAPHSILATPSVAPAAALVDWGEIPRPTSFYGRQSELGQLKAWLLHERCTLVSILGLGGVGKTALATQLVRGLRQAAQPDRTPHDFDRIIWQSLLNAPPLDQVLRLWLQDLSDQQLTALPTRVDEQLAWLFRYLRQQRCLLILDNFESILQAGEFAGHFRTDYENYGFLIQKMGELEHQSCLLLTSRELPVGIARLERNHTVVRSLSLDGLPAADGIELLRAAGVQAGVESMRLLVQRYSGNPLALQLIAETVLDHYRGDATSFLNQEPLIFDDIRTVLDQQLRRLSTLEQACVFWLTIEREPIPIQQLALNFAQPPAHHALLEAIHSLYRRSLVVREHPMTTLHDGGEARFGLQNVVLEYTTEQLRDIIYNELISEKLDHCLRYALLKAQATDYVRAAQVRLLLQPIASRLFDTYGLPRVASKLRKLVDNLRTYAPNSGYGGANLLHLALHLAIKLEHWDFSRLSIWQADLRKCRLPYTNFTQAQFANTAFMEKFDAILAVAFSPDGKLLAAGGVNSHVHLWQVWDSELLSICRGKGRWVWAVTFNPTGELLASAGSDGVVHLWEVGKFSRGETATTEVSPMLGHTDTIFGLAFHPAGQWLASASADHTIRIWDTVCKETTQILRGHTATVYAVAFHPQGQLLASASRDHTVRLWQVTTGHCIEVLGGHQSEVTTLCFSRDGQWLVTASIDNTILVWRLRVDESVSTPLAHLHHTIVNDGTEIMALALSPDGETIATNGPHATIRLWRRNEGVLAKTFHGHTENIQALTFHPNGKILISGGWDQSVRFWDIATGFPLRTLQGYTNAINELALSPDGQTVVSGNADGTLGLWRASASGLGEPHARHHLSVQNGAVQTVAFHSLGGLVASGGSDHIIRLWGMADGQLIERQTLRGHRGAILRLVFSPTGQLMVSSSADQTLCIWDPHTGHCLQELRGQTRISQALAFSPDGQYLVSGNDDGVVEQWEITNKLEEVQNQRSAVRISPPFATVPGGCTTLTFSPDGSLLAGAGPDHTIILWHVSNRQKWISLKTPVNSTIYALAFRPHQDKQLLQLASSSGTGAICFWNIDRNSAHHHLNYVRNDHEGSVRSLQFTPDGQTLISGGADETIKLWQVETGQCLATLPVEQPYIGMDITAATGLTTAQRAAVKTLGGFERMNVVA